MAGIARERAETLILLMKKTTGLAYLVQEVCSFVYILQSSVVHAKLNAVINIALTHSRLMPMLTGELVGGKSIARYKVKCRVNI